MKKVPSKKGVRLVKKVVLALIAVTSLVCFVFAFNQARLRNEQTGVRAVKLLYQFSTVEALNGNMGSLKKITTEAVYNQLTVDNEDRTLNTYLKFKGSSCKVEVIRYTDSYVLYSLDTENVGEDRVFVFLYKCNKSGKIAWVRECECLDFVEQ